MRWVRFAALALGLTLTYFAIVLFYKEVVFGVQVRMGYLALPIGLVSGSFYWVVRWAAKRQRVSANHLKNLTVAGVSMVVSLVSADIGFSVYRNMTTPRSRFADWNYERTTDNHIWTGESEPYSYYPTEENFLLYKPYVAKNADVYGEFYYKKLLSSPTLASSVLELRHVSFSIDEYGFRETTPLHRAHIFALGDSFVFGWSISQDKTWVERLEGEIKEPVYNLGVSGISPKQELMLLEYMLRTKPGLMKVDHLLWMIFEGNDLEEPYETYRLQLPHESDESRNLFEGTIERELHSIPLEIKEESIINRLQKGQIVFAPPSKDARQADHLLVDGTALVDPLYHSNKYGYRMFRWVYIERAGKSEPYVLNHPNRPLLDQTFKDMASLSQKYGFMVTVLIAPSAPRLYAPYFEDLPPISKEPYFINYVEHLSRSVGFNVINLYTLLRPYAEKELLYWRDDTHWNERGHQVVAETTRQQLGNLLISSAKSH
jgi:hypothetical protein